MPEVTGNNDGNRTNMLYIDKNFNFKRDLIFGECLFPNIWNQWIGVDSLDIFNNNELATNAFGNDILYKNIETYFPLYLEHNSQMEDTYIYQHQILLQLIYIQNIVRGNVEPIQMITDECEPHLISIMENQSAICGCLHISTFQVAADEFDSQVNVMAYGIFEIFNNSNYINWIILIDF